MSVPSKFFPLPVETRRLIEVRSRRRSVCCDFAISGLGYFLRRRNLADPIGLPFTVLVRGWVVLRRETYRHLNLLSVIVLPVTENWAKNCKIV